MTPFASSQPQRTPPGPLRLRRLTLGLTQAELATVAGVSREQIVRLEAGSCEPTWRTVRRLAAALDCSAADLFPVLNEKRPAAEPGASPRGLEFEMAFQRRSA